VQGDEIKIEVTLKNTWKQNFKALSAIMLMK
jgi:hypothetical protein